MELPAGGKTTLTGIAMTEVVLLVAFGMDLELGLPTAITGILTALIIVDVVISLSLST